MTSAPYNLPIFSPVSNAYVASLAMVMDDRWGDVRIMITSEGARTR